MMGNVQQVMPKRTLDFSSLPTGAQQEVILADHVDVMQWTEATLKIRIHSHTLAGTNQITIVAYPQSWTAEDPGLVFLDVPAGQTVLNSSTPSPGEVDLRCEMLLGPGALGSMTRVTAIGLHGTAGTMQASLSLELSTKRA